MLRYQTLSRQIAIRKGQREQLLMEDLQWFKARQVYFQSIVEVILLLICSLVTFGLFAPLIRRLIFASLVCIIPGVKLINHRWMDMGQLFATEPNRPTIFPTQANTTHDRRPIDVNDASVSEQYGNSTLIVSVIIVVAVWNRAGHYIFMLWFVLSSSSFFFFFLA